MDQFPTQQIHNRTKTKSNPFLRCFEFSLKARNKNFSEKIQSDDHILKRSRLLITWSRSRLKKSRSTRTVPLDAHTASKKLNPDKKINQLAIAKSKSDQIELVLPVVLHQNPQANPQETSHSSGQDTKLGNPKQSDHSHTAKGNTCQKLQSFSRKIDAIRNGSNQPGSPEKGRAKPKHNKIPSLMRQYSAVALPTQINQKQYKRVGLKNQLDPSMGMSIIMVTLLIMFLWGRLCAILCTATWFYFVPMLRNAMVFDIGIGIGSDSNLKSLDMNSEEYKKRVVLEGFLRRN